MQLYMKKKVTVLSSTFSVDS